MNQIFLLVYVIASAVTALYVCYRWSANGLLNASMKLFFGITGTVGVFITLKLLGLI